MDKKTLWVGLTSLAIIAVAAFLTILFTKADHFRGTAYTEPYPPAPNIELTRSNGDVFSINDQRGKVVLLFFGFAHCADVCPATMAELNQALNEIPNKAKSVEVVFITVDPDRDTPQIAQEYAGQFNPSFIGLSGSISDLEKIWNDYGIFREVTTNASGAVEVSHTARVMLIDKDGNLRLSYAFGTPVDDFVYDLNLLLK